MKQQQPGSNISVQCPMFAKLTGTAREAVIKCFMVAF
jgi:hypothetical protein